MATLAPRLLLAAGLALAAAGPAAAQTTPREELEVLRTRLPQGTSRLSPEQRLEAARLALADIEARGLRTDERLYLVSSQWFHDKGSSDLKAVVKHYRTEGDLTLTHRINLTKGAVEWSQAAADQPVPLSQEEFDQARELALADEKVRAALGARKGLVVEPMVLRGGERDAQGRRHRTLRLLFKVGRDYLSRPIVFVDLTTGRVEIEEEDPESKP
jgi:hypothetical protein